MLKIKTLWITVWGLPGGSVVKNPTANPGDVRSVPGLERSPGGGHGNTFQYSDLESPYGQRRLEGYSPWGPKELGTTE